MEILVCVKQVPDDCVEVHLTAEGKPDLANITPVVNAFDTYALENGCTPEGSRGRGDHRPVHRR